MPGGSHHWTIAKRSEAARRGHESRKHAKLAALAAGTAVERGTAKGDYSPGELIAGILARGAAIKVARDKVARDKAGRDKAGRDAESS